MTDGKTARAEGAGLEGMPELVIVTGMSGAGRTEAMHAFEDLGYFCVDNLPASLIGDLVAITGIPGQADEHRRIAVVCDARNRSFFSSLVEELKNLKEQGLDYRALFKDAADEKLIATSPAAAAIRCAPTAPPSRRASAASASCCSSCARTRTTSSTPPPCCRPS